MTELVFLLEEQSAAEMLAGLLPKLIPEGTAVRYVVFEGKQDLEKQLPKRIRGYRNPGARFVVLRDQDANPECGAVKGHLTALCAKSGQADVVVRVACRELESFYLADLAAVEKGLGVEGLARLQLKRKFRGPDKLGKPSQELATLTGGLYQKVGGSRAIGPWLDPDNARSDSFRNLVSGIRRLFQEGAPRVTC
jgi:hypothetical protein